MMKVSIVVKTTEEKITKFQEFLFPIIPSILSIQSIIFIYIYIYLYSLEKV